MEIYAAIIRLIPAWLLMLMAAVTAVGWAWRIFRQFEYAPPKPYKIFGALSYGLVAFFYGVVQWGDPPLVVSIAMIRIAWLLLLGNELLGHGYVHWLRRKEKELRSGSTKLD